MGWIQRPQERESQRTSASQHPCMSLLCTPPLYLFLLLLLLLSLSILSSHSKERERHFLPSVQDLRHFFIEESRLQLLIRQGESRIGLAEIRRRSQGAGEDEKDEEKEKDEECLRSHRDNERRRRRKKERRERGDSGAVLELLGFIICSADSFCVTLPSPSPPRGRSCSQ